MRIDRIYRKAIMDRVRCSSAITVDEIAGMLDVNAGDADIQRMIENEKKSAARRMLISLRGKDQLRTCYALCDKDGTFVNVDHSNAYEHLLQVENQLRIRRNGINRSLGKVTRLKKALHHQTDAGNTDTGNAAVLAEQLYAMADELQALLAM